MGLTGANNNHKVPPKQVTRHRDLMCRKTSSGRNKFKKETWYVDAQNDCIVRMRMGKYGEERVADIAWLSKSFGGHNFYGKFTKGFGYRRKKRKWLVDTAQVFVHFVARG